MSNNLSNIKIGTHSKYAHPSRTLEESVLKSVMVKSLTDSFFVNNNKITVIIR